MKHYLASKPHKRVSEVEARFLILQVIRGVSYCHQKGIIHRNLKPDNLLIKESITDKPEFSPSKRSFMLDSLDTNNNDYENILIKIGDFTIAGIQKLGANYAPTKPNSYMHRAPEFIEEEEIEIPRALDVWS